MKTKQQFIIVEQHRDGLAFGVVTKIDYETGQFSLSAEAKDALIFDDIKTARRFRSRLENTHKETHSKNVRQERSFCICDYSPEKVQTFYSVEGCFYNTGSDEVYVVTLNRQLFVNFDPVFYENELQHCRKTRHHAINLIKRDCQEFAKRHEITGNPVIVDDGINFKIKLTFKNAS